MFDRLQTVSTLRLTLAYNMCCKPAVARAFVISGPYNLHVLQRAASITVCNTYLMCSIRHSIDYVSLT